MIISSVSPKGASHIALIAGIKGLRCKVISQCRIYAQVQNAFTFTKYDGMDPEIGYGPEGDNGQGWVSGVDLGYYPRPRTVLFGVNLKF